MSGPARSTAIGSMVPIPRRGPPFQSEQVLLDLTHVPVPARRSSPSGHNAQGSGNPRARPLLRCRFEIGKEMPDQSLVLVAEDEELVRLVIVAALEDAGSR